MIYPLLRRLLFQLDRRGGARVHGATRCEHLQQIPIVLRAIERFCRPPASRRAHAARAAVSVADRHRRRLRQERHDDAVPRGARIRVHRSRDRDAAAAAGQSEAAAVPLSGAARRSSIGWASTTTARTRSRRDCAHGSARVPLFVNVGKNRDVPLEGAAEAYVECYRRVAPHADAAVLNLSSPNTPGLRDLQRPEHLEELLTRGALGAQRAGARQDRARSRRRADRARSRTSACGSRTA